MIRGQGTSLGAALVSIWSTAAGGGKTRTSYTARGWHAQLRALTGTRVGREAASAAGLSPTRRTLLAWLTEARTPTAANRQRITDAYTALASGWPRVVESRRYEIHGMVGAGRDIRDRGHGRSAPLRIDGAEGRWDSVKKEWVKDRKKNSQMLQYLFVLDVIRGNLGEPSAGGWFFPGSSYTIDMI
jgi:hypothetical protein